MLCFIILSYYRENIIEENCENIFLLCTEKWENKKFWGDMEINVAEHNRSEISFFFHCRCNYYPVMMSDYAQNWFFTLKKLLKWISFDDISILHDFLKMILKQIHIIC